MSTVLSKIPVFLCHGAGGDSGSCAALADALQAEAGIVPYTLSFPGRASEPGPACSSVSGLAAFVRERVATTLGDLDAPHVVLGHSMGGAVALEYALGTPPGLCALALVSTGARLRVHPGILTAFAGTDAALGPPVAGETAAGGLGLATSVPRASALADWRAADAFDRMADVHTIRTPTIILVGDADLLTPIKYARFLHEQIGGSQLVVLPSAGHSLPTEHPSHVAEHVASFLRQVVC